MQATPEAKTVADVIVLLAAINKGRFGKLEGVIFDCPI